MSPRMQTDDRAGFKPVVKRFQIFHVPTFVKYNISQYMARDKNGDLFLYSTKPNRDVDAYIVIDSRGNSIGYNAIDAAYFKFIRWEDEKIWSIRELKELKVEGNERD